MTPPGRNDPCHCGSGRKYKKCCLQKDIEAEGRPILDFTYESHLVLRRKATEKLDRLLVEVVGKQGFAAFDDEYWNPPFLEDGELDELLDNPEAERSLENQQDMALRNCALVNGMHPAEIALERHAGRFTGQEREFLKDFEEARLTYIQLKEFHPESGKVIAQDVFDGSTYTVFDKGVSVQGRPQDIVSCRLVRFPGKDGYVFETLATSIQPPQVKEFLVRTFVSLAEKEYPGRPTSEAIHAFLKTYPLNFYWVEMWNLHRNYSRKPPAMATSDGEDLVFIEARFSARNPEALVSALKTQRNFTHELVGRVHAFAWLNRKDMITGTLKVEPPSEILRLETNSRDRFRKWEKKLKTLGEVTFLEKREESLESAMARSSEQGGRPAAKSLSEDELKALAPELEEQFLSRWLKEKIPALGNRTPVQAAKDPKGRTQLMELLDIMENQSFRNLPKGMMASFDVDKARQRLGLST